MTITVYKVKNNINNKVLIGKSKARRLDTVLSSLRSVLASNARCTHREDLKQLFLNHRDTITFELEIVAVMSDESTARELRKELIVTTDNYNAVKKKGKESPAYDHTRQRGTTLCPECGGTKSEKSKTCHSCYLTSDRLKNSSLGVPRSEESKRKQSLIMTGRVRSDLRKRIFAYGDFYPSLTQAARATGVSVMTLSNRARASTCLDVYYLEEDVLGLINL